MRTALVMVTVLLAGLLLGSGPAYGHVSLISSDPANSATIDAPPSRVSLTFSAAVDARLSRVVVTADRRPVTTGTVRADGATVTVPVTGGPGRYRVVYRVVAQDGHRIDGEIGFTVAEPAGSPSGRPPTSPAGEPGTVAAPATDSAATPAAGAVTRSWVWLVVGLGGVLLIGALAYVLTVGRTRGKDVPTGGDTTDEAGGDAADPAG